MKDIIEIFQKKVLKLLSCKIDDFYLSGGTALSMFYFQHRASLDLDFFTKEFNTKIILEIIDELKRTLKKEIRLISHQTKKGMVKMSVYSIGIAKNQSLKIDFVEDYIELIKPLKNVDGINILSIDDIYIRKIYTITGSKDTVDIIGRRVASGRQEVKDIYDLYFLSKTFMPLSDFVTSYCDDVKIESLIYWFRTYDRMEMKIGLLELKTKILVDYRDIEQHFKKEIDKLIEMQIDSI